MKFKSLCISTGLAAMFVTQGVASHAVGIAFAQFTQRFANPEFRLNSGPASPPAYPTTSVLDNINAAGVPVNFSFLPGSTSTVGNGPFSARLFLRAENFQDAIQLGTIGNQFFHNVTFEFRADAAAPGVAIGDVLLRGVSGIIPADNNGGLLTGIENGTSATFQGADNPSLGTSNIVTFTSMFIPNFPSTVDDSYAFSFSNVDPFYNFITGGPPGTDYIRSFVATGTGTFAATLVPEPGTVAMLIGLGMSGAAVSIRRRRK